MNRGAILLLAIGASTSAAAESAVSWTVEAGTEAMLVEDHRARLASLRVEFPAGTWSPWVVRSHAREAFEIQIHDPAGRLRARADELAAGVVLSVGKRASTLEVSFLAEDLEGVLQLVRDILENRDLDRRRVSRLEQERQLDWKTSQKQPFFRGAQQAARVLFAERDPRRRPWEEPQPFTKDLARLVEARDTLIRLPGRIIAFAGDLTETEARRAAAGLLPPVVGDPPRDIAVELAPLVALADRPRSVTVPLPRLTQVYFGYVRESPVYTDASYPAFLIADHVLGGHFYSRLYVALRHEGGETYGAGSVSDGDIVEGGYVLATFTRTDNAAKTEEKLERVLATFHDVGIDEDERAAAVGYLRGRRVFDRQSPAQVLARRLEERRLALAPGYLDQIVERASELTVEEVNRFISEYYDPSRFTLVRVATR